MDDRRARALVAAERARIERLLGVSDAAIIDGETLDGQQTGETDSGSALATTMVDVALEADLREMLVAVERAEARLAAGTYGRSVDSGTLIPDARLEAEPLAERTVDEQRRVDG
jgi:DnaK suppressor protein